MTEIINTLDLLVHPFYSISKILSKFLINGESEQNILQLKKLWQSSIDDIANNANSALVLVNSVDIVDGEKTELHNPYGFFYRCIDKVNLKN